MVIVVMDDKKHCARALDAILDRIVQYGHKDEAAARFEYGHVDENGKFVSIQDQWKIDPWAMVEKYPDLFEKVKSIATAFQEHEMIQHGNETFLFGHAWSLANYDVKYVDVFVHYLSRVDLDHDTGVYRDAIYSLSRSYINGGNEDEGLKLLTKAHGTIQGIDAEMDDWFERESFDKLSDDQTRIFFRHFLVELGNSRHDIQTFSQALNYDVYYDDEDEMPLPEEMMNKRMDALHKIAWVKLKGEHGEANKKIREENLHIVPSLSELLDPYFDFPKFKEFLA